VNKATAMFAETIENLLTFDAGFTWKLKLYIKLQARKPKDKNHRRTKFIFDYIKTSDVSLSLDNKGIYLLWRGIINMPRTAHVTRSKIQEKNVNISS
jgi:hypothetical protein